MADKDKGTASGYLPLDAGYATRAIHHAQSPDQWKSRAVIPPITLSSTYKVTDPDFPDYSSKEYHYGRLRNPSREIVEKCIASLDNAKYGLCYSSGMAALTNMLHVVVPGQHVIGASDVYGGTHSFLSTLAVEQGLETSFFDALDPEALEREIRPNTKMVWVESSSNPLLHIVDIRKMAEICRRRSKDIILVVDNTFMTSYFQKPLDLGAHVVMYSVSKYMNGHSDVIMGALVLNDEAINKRLRHLQNYLGSVPSPFDCYLVNRGLKTLAVRMRQHMANSMEVATFLEAHPLVEKVMHPGLASHPQHALFQSQASGHSGMMAFCIKGAGIQQALKFMQSLKFIMFAGSLGGVESLVASPALMSHVVLSPEERRKMGVTDNLIRFSVGIEDAGDLKRDLDQALRAALAGEE